MKCPYCDQELPKDATVCPNCALPLPEKPRKIPPFVTLGLILINVIVFVYIAVCLDISTVANQYGI